MVAAISAFLVIASLLSRSPVLLVAIVQLFIAGATVVSYVWQDEIPYAFAQLVVGIPVDQLAHHVGTVNIFMFLTIVLCTLPATLGMGAMFPLAVRVWTSGGEKIAKDVASVYTGNTIGSIIGAWLPGFVLFALVGAERTLHIGIALNMILALVMLIAGAADPNEDQTWWTWRRLGAVSLPALGVLFFVGAVGLGAIALPPPLEGFTDRPLLRAGIFAPLLCCRSPSTTTSSAARRAPTTRGSPRGTSSRSPSPSCSGSPSPAWSAWTRTPRGPTRRWAGSSAPRSSRSARSWRTRASRSGAPPPRSRR